MKYMGWYVWNIKTNGRQKRSEMNQFYMSANRNELFQIFNTLERNRIDKMIMLTVLSMNIQIQSERDIHTLFSNLKRKSYHNGSFFREEP